jgi:two-component system sensor histidine kinase/response regulator
LDKPVSQSRLWDTLAGIIRPEPTAMGPSRLQPVGTGQLVGLRVLLVEDNEINQQIARELLESMGVQVTLADNGQQALDLLQAAIDPLPWSAVLMDLQMPVMDGHQATLTLRAQLRFQALPIIALTAHASSQEAARCLSEGMNAHLSKPIDPETLFNCLAQWARPVATFSAEALVQKAQVAMNTAVSERSVLHINGIDVAFGLRQCAGNQALYGTLLDKFMQSIHDLPAQLQSALTEGRFEDAEHAVHSLKGVAGNIGAKHCGMLSAALELALNQAVEASAAQPPSVPDLQACLAPLLQHLGQLASALRLALPAAKTSPSGQAPDADQLRRVCRELADLLQANNAEAEMLLQSQGDALRAGLGAGFGLLQRQVQDFEFSDALVTLQQAAAAAHINLN